MDEVASVVIVPNKVDIEFGCCQESFPDGPVYFSFTGPIEFISEASDLVGQRCIVHFVHDDDRILNEHIKGDRIGYGFRSGGLVAYVGFNVSKETHLYEFVRLVLSGATDLKLMFDIDGADNTTGEFQVSEITAKLDMGG